LMFCFTENLGVETSGCAVFLAGRPRLAVVVDIELKF